MKNFLRQIWFFCNANANANVNAKDDAEILKPRFQNDRNLPNTSTHFFCIAGVNSFFQNFHLPQCRVSASNIIWELCYSTAYKVSVFGAVLVRIFRHLGWILRISPYSFRMQENTYQNNSQYRQFWRSARERKKGIRLLKLPSNYLT